MRCARWLQLTLVASLIKASELLSPFLSCELITWNHYHYTKQFYLPLTPNVHCDISVLLGNLLQ